LVFAAFRLPSSFHLTSSVILYAGKRASKHLRHGEILRTLGTVFAYSHNLNAIPL